MHVQNIHLKRSTNELSHKERELGRMIRMNYVSVYNRNTKEYLGSFKNTIGNIANYIASLIIEDVMIVDDISDECLITTKGMFLDYVSDNQLRNRLMKKLVPLQMSGEYSEVEIIQRR